jgi:hypothetical protein
MIAGPATWSGFPAARFAWAPTIHYPEEAPVAEFAWGNELTPGGKHMADTWQGEFPRQNLSQVGYERTSPVAAFPANGYGVHERRARRGQLRFLPAEYQNPAQGDQGRIASLRAELLPPLSAAGASRRSSRYVNKPSRIPLREEDSSRGIDEFQSS